MGRATFKGVEQTSSVFLTQKIQKSLQERSIDASNRWQGTSVISSQWLALFMAHNYNQGQSGSATLRLWTWLEVKARQGREDPWGKQPGFDLHTQSHTQLESKFRPALPIKQNTRTKQKGDTKDLSSDFNWKWETRGNKSFMDEFSTCWPENPHLLRKKEWPTTFLKRRGMGHRVMSWQRPSSFAKSLPIAWLFED